MFKSFYHNYLNHFLKFGLLVAMVYYIYAKTQKESWNEFVEMFTQHSQSFSFYGIILLLLICVVGIVFCETYKWQCVMKKVEPISISIALQGVLTGFTFSLFTPNRVGDYVGRIFYLKKTEAIDGIALSLVSSFAQICVLFAMGLPALLLFIAKYYLNQTLLAYILVTIAFLLSALSVFIFFYVDIWIHTLPLKFRIKKLQHIASVISTIAFTDLAYLLFLSISKYVLSMLPFYFIMQFFQVEISLIWVFILCMCQFFTQAFIPSFAIAEWGLRGSIALFYWGHCMVDQKIVLFASTTIWFFNILIPAIVGLFFIFKLRFIKSKSYENNM